MKKWSPKPIKDAIREGRGDFGAINAAMTDFKVQVVERVKTMESYLKTGTQPQKYIDQHEQELKDIFKSVEDETTTVDVKAYPGIAIVKLTHLKGPQIGYSKAPGVVAFNEKFHREGSDEDQIKFSICQIPGVKVFDFGKLTTDLNKLEKEHAPESQGQWGGNPNFLASPMNNGTKIPVNKILETVISDIFPDYQSLFSEVPSDLNDSQITQFVGEMMAGYTYHQI